jgi:hypothetical protein
MSSLSSIHPKKEVVCMNQESTSIKTTANPQSSPEDLTEEQQAQSRLAKAKKLFEWLEAKSHHPDVEDDFRQFVEIVDGERPSGYKVFSHD